MPADVGVLLPALTAAGGISAAIFTALRFNRDDASAVVNQQKEVLGSMKALNDELQDALDRMRTERNQALERISQLEKTVIGLESTVAQLQRRLDGV